MGRDEWVWMGKMAARVGLFVPGQNITSYLRGTYPLKQPLKYGAVGWSDGY